METITFTQQKQPRQIHTIAEEIQKDWKDINVDAKPYLGAMFYLSTIKDSYGLESSKSIILYFLSNATSWRGDTARRVKAELRWWLEEIIIT
jgi:hypothetical protein